MVHIIHRIGIKASSKQVYNALSTIQGLSHWWTENVKGDEHVDGKITFRFHAQSGEEIGVMIMEIRELNPDAVVQWRCIDGPPEWIGTEIKFELSQQDEQTIIIFGHRDWLEEVEFKAHCSMKWAVFLLSLREYVETGKGRPSPRDLKIDNWN